MNDIIWLAVSVSLTAIVVDFSLGNILSILLYRMGEVIFEIEIFHPFYDSIYSIFGIHV